MMEKKAALNFSTIMCLLLLSAVGSASTYYNENGHSEKIYLPSNYTPNRPWPVILLLHGYTGNQALIDSYFGFSSQVSKYGFILVTANGMVDSSGYRYWNASDGCCDFDHRNNNDVAYLKKLIEELQSKYAVDAKRIYVAGHSNGGFMAHRLACDLSGTVAAIASFAGETLQDAEKCEPTSPVSILQIQAVDDDTIFYAGDKKGYPHLAPYPGAIETVNRWLAFDQCQGVRSTQRVNLTLSIPGPDTSVNAWNTCAKGTSVELWTIDPHEGLTHFPHTPLLREEFTERVLKFLLQKRRE